MKKLFAFILVLAFLFPSFAFAEDTDPLVGYWYVFIDLQAYPEMADTAGDFDTMLSLYYFDPSGLIYLLENDVKDGAASPVFTRTGRWEKAESGYNISILGIGETTLNFYGPAAYLQIPNTNLSMKLRNLTRFNPYKDYSK